MEDLNLDNNLEKYNKQILKQTAITFSLDGISKDLKYFIQKRVTHNRISLSYLTRILDLAVNSGSKTARDSVFKKGNPLQEMLEHMVKEIISTDILIDDILESIVKKEKYLTEDGK